MRLGLLAAILLVPAAAGGDELSTLHGLDVRDASHRVEVSVSGRVAGFRIAHTLVSRDRRDDEVFLDIALPEEGAAVGLRARAAGRWHPGRLLGAEQADQRYEMLTQSGRPGGGLGAAILTWSDTEKVSFSAFPVARRRPAELEVSAVAPLCYAAGLAVAYYPRPTQGDREPVISVRSPRRHWIVRPGRPVPAALADRWAEVSERCAGPDQETLAIAVAAEPAGPVAAAAASLDLKSGRRVVWIEVEAARELERVPRGARVLFVLDGSRSLGAAGMAAQLDLVRGYLAQVPDAEFELVVYRRRASRLLGRFQPAVRAPAILRRLSPGALGLENGSHLDQGLALAGDLARGARGPVRIVAFNDDLVRGALGARAMAAALGRLPRGSVAHLVELTGGGGAYEWQRDDKHPFADGVMTTGGMLVSMSGDDGSTGRAAMRGLVRPLRVDGFRIEGAHLGNDLAGSLDEDGSLAAGVGIRLTALTQNQAEPLRARGRIWGRELSLPIAIDRELEAALPALIFGGTRWADLDDAEQLEAAQRGGVVTPDTSLLVELDELPTAHDELLGSSGCGCMGGSSHTIGSTGVGSIGRITGRRSAPEPDRQAILAGALQAPLAACSALHGAAPIALTIETTVGEVVDVAVETGGSPALADCATEAGWALALDDRFNQDHATFPVRFDRP